MADRGKSPSSMPGRIKIARVSRMVALVARTPLMLTQPPLDGEREEVLRKSSAEPPPKHVRHREAATKRETTEDRMEISSFVTQVKPLAAGRFKSELNRRETAKV